MSKAPADHRLNQRQLIRAVADDCDYLIYEVQDVLEGLRRVITAALSEGKEVKLEHLFTISPKVNKPRPFLNPQTGETEVSSGSVSCSVKLTQYLKDVLNGDTKGPTVGEPKDFVEAVEVQQKVQMYTKTDVQSQHENTTQPKRKFTAADQISLL